MKVQLVLLGGRSSVPNILTILHQKPDVVITLCSHESHSDFPRFKHMVETALPTCTVEELSPVDAFEPEEIANQCIDTFQLHSEAEWLCNITAATSIMSIVVYEQAKKFQKDCWYVNTSKARVITLIGAEFDDKDHAAIFHLPVSEYVSANYYLLESGNSEERRASYEQDWLPFAQLLGQRPILINHLKFVMNAVGKQQRPGKKEARQYTFPNLPQEAHAIMKEAERFGLANDVRSEPGKLTFTLNYLQDSFLNGGWLEVYVWYEAKQIKSLDNSSLFDDCQWNHKVTIAGVTRELDIALMYKAQLIIVECKTGDETKDSATLNGLVSVANPLGGKFVGKILISSLFSPDNDPDQTQRDGTYREKIKGHKEFLAKADHHHIVPIMAEDLPRIRDLLKKEAITPKYPRI